jgi:methionyl-tRNA formyltransferase
MFNTIILLAGTAEQVALPPVLRGHNPLLTVISAGTSADLAALNADVLERARLITFVTPEIVSKSILARLGYGAFNFHPGPPSYPGWAPAHFAL